MQDELKRLANIRWALEKLGEEANELMEKYQNTDEYIAYRGVMEQLQKTRKDLNEADQAFRDALVASYEQTGETKFPGGSVKMYKVYQYDERKAVEWCAEHATQSLSLKKANFKKIAAAMDLEFVKIEEVPTAYVDSDLSEFV